MMTPDEPREVERPEGPCPVCGSDAVHLYKGRFIDRGEWHRLDDGRRAASAASLERSAEYLESLRPGSHHAAKFRAMADDMRKGR